VKRQVAIAALLSACALASAAQAQLALSANDGKQLRPGETPASRTPDAIAVIDLDHGLPRVLGSAPAPASMIGPPTTAAVARDSSFAVVTSNQQLDPADPAKLKPADLVSVIDLTRPSAPRLAQSLHAGLGATGVSIDHSGRLVLVANSEDDTVSVFKAASGRLTAAGVVQLDAKSRPIDVAIAPGGAAAWVTAQAAGKLVRLTLASDGVRRDGIEIAVGLQPAGLAISPDGRFAYVTLQGGRLPRPDPPPAAGPKMGAVAVVDLSAARLVQVVDVGVTPEQLGLSPDGRWIAMTVINGSSSPPGSPNYHAHGQLKVYAVNNGAMTPTDTAETGQWCQGSAWSRDSRRLLLQCAADKEIEVFDFDGAKLHRRSETLRFGARPGAIATGFSR
jgi:hypothetical protein